MGQIPDCIVVGGGVIGLSVAWKLAGNGLHVSLLERGLCGAEASWAGAGVLAPCNPHRKDEIAALRDRSLALYPRFCTALQEESGIDPEFERCGELEIALNEDALRSLLSNVEAGAGLRDADGCTAYVFHSPEETRGIEPAVSGPNLGAMECRLTAQVRNPRLLRALAAACIRRGVDIREQSPVHDFVQSGQRVTGVRLNHENLEAGKVILCAGAWSSSIGAHLHALMPVRPVRGQMILLKLESRAFTHVISRGKTYLVPRRDGHILLGATEEPDAGFVKRNTASGLAGLFANAVKLVPGIGEAAVITQWAGLRPGTSDDNPHIGPVPGFEGLIAATGHFRAGLILAPLTAELVADIVAGKNPNLAAIAPGRPLSGQPGKG